MNKLSNEERQSILRNRLKFNELAKGINVYLKEKNLNLNLGGYTATIQSYLKVNDNDLLSLSELIKDLNLWSNFIGDLEAFIQFQYLKLDNKLQYLNGFFNMNIRDKELLQQINDTQQRVRHFKLFGEHLKTQKKMFITAYMNCLKAYDEAVKTLNYRY